jgi:integration host factor subunit beta
MRFGSAPVTKGRTSMTKSDLIDIMASGQSTLSERDVEYAIKLMLQQMSDALASGERIEIRGFGSFTLHSRPARTRPNPKTGGVVAVPAGHVPHFKLGKQLRDRVNAPMAP